MQRVVEWASCLQWPSPSIGEVSALELYIDFILHTKSFAPVNIGYVKGVGAQYALKDDNKLAEVTYQSLAQQTWIGICFLNGLEKKSSFCGLDRMFPEPLHWRIWVLLCGLQGLLIILGSPRAIKYTMLSTNYLWQRLEKFATSMLLIMGPRWSFEQCFVASGVSRHPSCLVCCCLSCWFSSFWSGARMTLAQSKVLYSSGH